MTWVFLERERRKNWLTEERTTRRGAAVLFLPIHQENFWRDTRKLLFPVALASSNTRLIRFNEKIFRFLLTFQWFSSMIASFLIRNISSTAIHPVPSVAFLLVDVTSWRVAWRDDDDEMGIGCRWPTRRHLAFTKRPIYSAELDVRRRWHARTHTPGSSLFGAARAACPNSASLNSFPRHQLRLCNRRASSLLHSNTRFIFILFYFPDSESDNLTSA